MKRKILKTSAVLAAMVLSTSIPSFAQWVSTTSPDGQEWMWQKDDGYFVYDGWVTDPETGNEYYMDMSGYMMRGTRINGFWLDDNGIKHEKSEAELAAEAAREAREATRISTSPAKAQKAAKEAAEAAKNATTATSTTRLSYQAELNTLGSKIFSTLKTAVKNNPDCVRNDSTSNLDQIYNYTTLGGLSIINLDLTKASNPDSKVYVPHAVTIHYNRNLIHDAETATALNTAFNSLLTASLGEATGISVYDQIMALEVGSDATLDLSGVTDTGNNYSVRYRSNNTDVTIICSEIVPETETATDTLAESTEAATSEAEAAVNETAAQQTTSVITAGSHTNETASDEAVSDETTSEN